MFILENSILKNIHFTYILINN